MKDAQLTAAYTCSHGRQDDVLFAAVVTRSQRSVQTALERCMIPTELTGKGSLPCELIKHELVRIINRRLEAFALKDEYAGSTKLFQHGIETGNR